MTLGVSKKNKREREGVRPRLRGCENLNGKNDDIFGLGGAPLDLVGIDLDGLDLVDLEIRKEAKKRNTKSEIRSIS